MNYNNNTPRSTTPTASPIPTRKEIMLPNSQQQQPLVSSSSPASSSSSSTPMIPAITPVTLGGTNENAAITPAAAHPQLPRHIKHEEQLVKPNNGQQVRFSWIVARALVKLMIQPAESFRLNGHPWSSWTKTRVPTLGASPTSCRVQEMFKVTIPPVRPGSQPRRVFAKAVPIKVWRRQWENQNKWAGEFVTDGENFVMEAAALAFLEQYGPDLAPKLLGVLELCGPIVETENEEGDQEKKQKSSSTSTTENGENTTDAAANQVTHIVILSELYGEDLLDFLERRDRKGTPLSDEEKRILQLDCIMLLWRLHAVGLSHLDFTPENVLIGMDGLRVCDFAKATPLYSHRIRHVRALAGDKGGLKPFESCEPTVGKGAYMPPECWSIYWRLEEAHLQYPLDELWALSDPAERKPFYFSVASADAYMAGVLLFWLWSEGGIWKCSDPQQDNKYAHLVKSGLNFDLFRECRSWPAQLKSLLQAVLNSKPSDRATLDDMLAHPWFQGCVPSSTRWRWSKMGSVQRNNEAIST